MPNRKEQTSHKAMKLFFKTFLVIGSLLAGSVTLFYRAELKTFLSEMKIQEKHTLNHQSSTIRDKFDAIVGDLLFLSRQNELRAYLKPGDAHAKKAIESEYIEISRAKRNYDQIRYLDADGMELVRVNYAGGKPESVPDGKLQSKSRRYYFTDAFVLEEGEIFVSPLDLNVEQGQVEWPYKPMIRFGTPVFDDSGAKKGIVLLNYLAANLLERLDTRQEKKESFNMLVNSDGYWLLHPEKEKEWGFMFKERAQISFDKAYPEEWHKIRQQEAGQIQTKNGLFTFVTIYPLKEGFRSSSGSGEPYVPSLKDLDPSEYFWVLVSQIPSNVMLSHTRELMSRLFIIGAGLFIIIAYGAWHFALAITKRRIYQAQLIELAHYDALTGLPNRKLFFDRLEEGLFHNSRHGRKLGLLYIDLDGFKNVNDTLGHDAGDELLQEVGARLKKNVRRTDIVSRLGGDEFAVILVEINQTGDPMIVGEKIVTALRVPFKLKSGTAKISASVGVAIFPDHKDTVDSLLQHADQAMYKAKAEGKSTCIMADFNNSDNRMDT